MDEISSPTSGELILQPQPGPQHEFLATEADICIYGGAAFGGKTWGLLFEALRHTDNPDFGFVIFRRNATQVRNEGGLWDESEKMYPHDGAVPRESTLEWIWPSGASGKFAHLDHETTKYDWQGAQVCYIGFDELTHFSAGQFWYLLSRNRSSCGVRPYIRATCNPDPESFVAALIAWWIDQETGYPIPGRSGILRYFVRRDNELIWGDSRQELADRFPDLDADNEIKTLTFIAANIEDNPIGNAADPGYRGNLLSLPRVERLRLLGGNWKVRPAAGQYFQRGWFSLVEEAPPALSSARGWDLGGTDEIEVEMDGKDPSWTVGVKMILGIDDVYYVTHVEALRGSPGRVRSTIRNTADLDGRETVIRLPQDPGQAGKDQAQQYIRLLAGFTARTRTMSGDKETRAGALSAQVEGKHVRIVKGAWNEQFLSMLEGFPDVKHSDDFVDAAVEAFEHISHGFYKLSGGVSGKKRISAAFAPAKEEQQKRTRNGAKQKRTRNGRKTSQMQGYGLS